MRRPVLLDGFCCQGGAARGYAAAGFLVVGVDIKRQRHYPYPFIQADAVAFIREYGRAFDAVHVSPPCQPFSRTRHTHHVEHPDLLEPARAAVISTGRPYVIENVEGAPLDHPLTLCGSEFDLTATDVDGTPLRLQRHRLFESNVFLTGNGGCRHDTRVQVGGAYGGGSEDRTHARESRHGGYTPRKDVRARLLGIAPDAMTLYGLSQSVPPAYTEHIGHQLLDVLGLAA